MYDELLAVNGANVSRMDHGEIMTLIKAASTQIKLSIQSGLDAVTRQQMVRRGKGYGRGYGRKEGGREREREGGGTLKINCGSFN